MTGDIFMRLRESMGISRQQLNGSLNWGFNSVHYFERSKRPKRWRAQIYINALREVSGRTKRGTTVAHEHPKGTTHILNDEPVRLAIHHGQPRGFRWDGSDWVRSMRVEEELKNKHGKAIAGSVQ